MFRLLFLHLCRVSRYVSMYACIHIYMYMCLCIRICIYTSPYAFFNRACMHPQVLLSTMHVQVCTLDSCCEHQRTHLLRAHYRMCMRYVYTRVYAYVYVYIYVYACIYIYICMYVCTYICIFIWMCICVYVYVYVCIYMYVCICMCIHIYINIYVSISHVCAVCFI